MKSFRLRNEHDDIVENSCLQMIHTPTIEINQSMSTRTTTNRPAVACDAARQCPGDRIIIAYSLLSCFGKRSMRQLITVTLFAIFVRLYVFPSSRCARCARPQIDSNWSAWPIISNRSLTLFCSSRKSMGRRQTRVNFFSGCATTTKNGKGRTIQLISAVSWPENRKVNFYGVEEKKKNACSKSEMKTET